MLESNMNHVERLLQYTATPAEAPLALAADQRWDVKRRQIVERRGTATSHTNECAPTLLMVSRSTSAGDGASEAHTDAVAEETAQWPTQGRVEFKNVWMRYRGELDHVLKGIDLVIEPFQTGTQRPSSNHQ
jgi:ABC-type multidrug transport system fused ATPase/permease subunit